MKIFNLIKETHDKLLSRELGRPTQGLGIFLFIVGLVGAIVGWHTPEATGKSLLLSGGLALGLAAEKFAQAQIRRIKAGK